MKYCNSYSRGVSEFIFKKTKERQIKEKKRFFYLSNSTTCTTVVFSISRFICINVILLVENFHHSEASDWTKVVNDMSLADKIQVEAYLQTELFLLAEKAIFCVGFDMMLLLAESQTELPMTLCHMLL